MRCIFCNEYAGFLQSRHDDCYQKARQHLEGLEQIVNQYAQGTIDAKDAKTALISLTKSNVFYENYLKHQLWNHTAIRTNETIIYIESMVSIMESKNRGSMVSTGFRYEKKPEWNVANQLICENAEVVFTDKQIYMLLGIGKGDPSYSYSKIVNLGYNEKWGHAYFDVATTSPIPRRFSIKSLSKSEKTKSLRVYLFLNCLTAWASLR